MTIAYLIFGFVFGILAAVLTLANGGGWLLALLSYGAGGALAILLPIAAHLAIGSAAADGPSWAGKEDQKKNAAA